MPWLLLRSAVCVLVALMMVIGGCRSNLPETKPSSPEREIRDSQGVVLKLVQKPQRIVSLSIGTDEILMDLVPAERIAALTYLSEDGGISNISDRAKQIPHKIKANAEGILALQPGLVIIPDWQPVELIDILRSAGINVYVYKSPDTIEEIIRVIGEIAAAVGEESTGAAMVNQMNSELKEIADKLQSVSKEQQPVVMRYGLLGGTGGIGSTFDDICRYAKVKNAAALGGLDKSGNLAKEQVVKLNPDIILLPTWDYTGKTNLQHFQEDLEKDPALQPVSAIRQRRLVAVPDRYLYCTSQYIVQGVRAVAAAAYPQLLQ